MSRQLHDFLKVYPEFEIKAAIQLIKGKHSTKEFKEGALKISDEEYMEASKKAAALFSEKLNTKVVVAFYRAQYSDVCQTTESLQNAAH